MKEEAWLDNMEVWQLNPSGAWEIVTKILAKRDKYVPSMRYLLKWEEGTDPIKSIEDILNDMV